MKNNVDPKQTVEKVACLLSMNGKSSILGTHSVRPASRAKKRLISVGYLGIA